MRTTRTGFLLPACVGVVVAALSALFLLGDSTAGWQVVACWLTVAVFASLMAGYARRASRLMDRANPERRFWVALSAAGVIFAAGEWVQTVTALVDPHATATQTGTGIARTAALGLGGLLITIVVLTYPIPHRGAKERLCYLLDLATVVTAGAAFGAYWTASGAWGDNHRVLAGDLAGVAAGPVVAMVAAFAVGRLYLSGAAPFRWHIGLLGPVAAGVEAIARALGPGLAAAGRPGLIFALSVGSHGMLLVAAWLQHHQWLSGTAARPVVRKRPYSLLPYVALAATFLLLVVTLVVNGLDLRAWIILAGAVASTGIVVARQIAAFLDNTELLRERDRLTATLHEMAFTDSLTGLANRAQFLDRLEAALRTDPAVGVLLIDLDDFKPVNDRFGHAAGDAVLVETARRLGQVLRSGDVVARLGGDEFAVLARQPAADLADRVVRVIAEPYRLASGETVRVGVSVGVAIAGDDDGEALLHRADQAMYQAKSDGKGAFRLHPAATVAGPP